MTFAQRCLLTGVSQCESFMELLAVDEAHLQAYLSQKPELSLVGRDVVFAPNNQNQPRPKKVKETVSFERLLPVLNILAS